VIDLSLLFLGVIAAATLTMAVIQIGAIVYAGRLSRRVEQLISRVEQDVQPVVHRASAVAGDAARVAALAVTQMERIDRLTVDFTKRAEQTMSEVQRAIVVPAREGFALISGIRAALGALQGFGARGGPARTAAHEDEDPLFIG
jgi:hypothetical protein